MGVPATTHRDRRAGADGDRRNCHLRGEYEYLNYEFINFDLTTGREGFNSVFGGVGFANPIGPNGALNVMVLYNFSYDSNDPSSPYADPYVFRIGVSFGF